MSGIASERICTFVKLQYILVIFIIYSLFCYREFPDHFMHMSFNFGTEIWNIKGFTKMGLQLFWWVQAFGLL